jgi:hypothetical protein
MWFLKNSKDLLEYIQSRFLPSCNSIKTFDFSTLCTNIHHSKLKDKLRELVQLCFIKRNGQRRCKYLMLGRDRSYFIKKTTLILSKSSLKLISSTCSSFWLTTFWPLCCLFFLDIRILITPFWYLQTLLIWCLEQVTFCCGLWHRY